MASFSRDEFSETVKRTISARVNNRCSRPDCRAPTSGPQLESSKAVNVGVAAHITAAAPGGARYDANLSAEQRAGIANAIWLCQNCAKLIDNDPAQFSADVLRGWKDDAENEASRAVGKTAPARVHADQVIDKWVGFDYPEKAGIAAKLKDEGYDLHWSSAKKESERIDLDGWQPVQIPQADGKLARLKVADPSVGGYLILLKRRKS